MTRVILGKNYTKLNCLPEQVKITTNQANKVILLLSLIFFKPIYNIYIVLQEM